MCSPIVVESGGTLVVSTVVPYSLAYLDGGSISLVVAAIGGGVAGLRVVGRVFWHRIGRWACRQSNGADEA